MKFSSLIHFISAANVVAFASAFAFAPGTRSSFSTLNSYNTKADLEVLAEKSNPFLGYFDPIGLADQEFWNQSQEATIGFLRHSEIKHGRVAMAAFVGYCVQSSSTFPWPQTLAGDLHPSASLSPEAQWDATPLSAKFQIILVIGLLEIWDELGGNLGEDNGDGLDHYMKGRQPGKYPTFDQFTNSVHFVPNLYDPFGLWKNMKDKTRERRLVAEINNGRLAMIGIFSVLAADSVAGSVPLLADTARSYDGDIMAPFGSDFSLESNTVVGIISTIGATASLVAGNKSAKRQEEKEEEGLGVSAGAGASVTSAGEVEVDLSIPYDAPARLAYEASDDNKSLDYDEFRLKFEAEAVKEASEKWAKMFSPVKA